MTRVSGGSLGSPGLMGVWVRLMLSGEYIPGEQILPSDEEAWNLRAASWAARGAYGDPRP